MTTQKSPKDKKRTVDVLRNGIEQAITVFGNGFFTNTSNTTLRTYVYKGTENRHEVYKQLVRLIFRLVFLLIAEERNLLISANTSKKSNDRYIQHHSLRRLCHISNERPYLKHENIWHGLVLLMEKLQHGCSSLGIPPLDSFLWKSSSCALLTKENCSNEYIIEAIQILTCTNLNNPIDWHDISAEDLGAIYESLLELHLEIDINTWNVVLSTQSGHERKSTGSYYTPAPLVDCLLKATLAPAIDKATKNKIKEDQEQALLQLRICDPSCGSGLFVIAAAKYLAKRLAKIRSVDQEPSSDCIQQAIRDVIQRCVYGVDINPMSVELCKISLWMEMNTSIDSFSSLHSQIQCGNALLGIIPDQIADGIRPDFFTFVKDHDEKTVRNRIAAKNRKEYKNRISSDVAKNNQIIELNSQQEYLVLDVLLSALLWPKISEENWESSAPTQQVFTSIVNGTSSTNMMKYVQRLKTKHQFFHWHLAFPHIFDKGGFDVVIGNPPYLDSEFLTKNHPYQRIAITHLYSSARGNWDIYIPFTELGIRLLKVGGFHAFVTPNKILGSKYSAALHQTCFFTQQLREIHDFSHLSLFDGASVSVVIVVTEKKGVSPTEDIVFYQYQTDPKMISSHTKSTTVQLQKLPAGFISFPITSPEPKLLKWLDHSTSFLDIALVCDGATAGEAYEIQPMVQEGIQTDWSSEDKIKLVNTGTIDPFILLWNQKKITYLGFKGVCPVIDAHAFQKRFPRRYRQAMQKNIVMAGMSKQLEAAVAPKGVLCGKSAVLLQPKPGVCPYALAVLLNSTGFGNLYRGLFAMRGMGGTSLNIGPRQIELLPAPNHQYLQEYTQNIHAHQALSTSTIHNRLSLIGKLLHQERDSIRLDLAEQTVRTIMNLS